ncbi:hypothetical protein GOODEAATRI_000278 [Goodea atripinnis]|uniref:Ig-like domain-containing protein n=1 Tax=Goodea atripinnis TaxID=208336 RepID=A0ABV0NGB8_9TELE
MPPTFTKSLKRVDGNVGNDASMDCKVSGSQPMTIVWFKDDQEVELGAKFQSEFKDSSATLRVNRLEKADSGVYKCRATNSAGSKETSGTLYVKEPPVFTEKPENQDVIPGAKVSFRAAFTGTAPLAVKWFKEEKEVVTGGIYFIKKDASSSSLELHSVKPSDSSKYTCQVSNDAGKVDCSAVLFVKEPPVFVRKLDATKLVTSGDSTRLECKASGSPVISFKWFKDEMEISSEPPKFTRTPARVSVVRPGQSKVFECQVTGTPEIDIYWFKEGSEISAGDRYKMAFICCKISGSLPISVEWQKDGSKISSGVKHKLIQQDNSVSVEIEHLERSDAGSYSCKLTNAAGRCECSGSLRVKGQKLLFSLTGRNAALPNATVRFKSTFTGTPPFMVKWFKDDTELMTGPTCFTGVDEMSCFLELYSVAVVQSGIYSCQVSNDAGSVRCKPPEFVLKLPASKFVKRDESLRLECKVRGTAPLKTTWYKHDTKVSDGGNYRTSFVDSVAGKDVSLYCEMSGSAPFQVTWFKDRKPLMESRKYKMVALPPLSHSAFCAVFVLSSEPPSFVEKLSNMTVMLGEEVTLMATVKGSEPITVSWVQDKDHVLRDSDNRKITFENNQVALTVFKADATVAGRYTCQLRNDAGSVDCFANLTVLEPAMIVDKPDTLSVTAGDMAALEVKVCGTPELVPKWFKDGMELATGRKYKISFSQMISSLNVLSTEKLDSGEIFPLPVCGPGAFPGSTYFHLEHCTNFTLKSLHLRLAHIASCLLCDPVLSTAAPAYKTVPPTFTRKLKDWKMTVGEAAEMECKVSGSPPFIISWYHDGQEIQSGPNCEVSFSDNSCTLRVPTLRLSDSGIYKCKAVNEAGFSETSATLAVKGQFLLHVNVTDKPLNLFHTKRYCFLS